MKKLFLILLLSLSLNAFSQILDPVKWTTSVEKVSDTKYKLITKATIESGWHLYSQNVPEDGPIPTTFLYGDEDDTAFKVIGNTSEDIGHTVDDPVFNMKIKFFEESATFTQTIEVIDSINEVRGTVEFMVCDDTRCLPPTEVDLVFNMPIAKKQASNNFENKQTGMLQPVKWQTSVDKISETEYDLVIKAEIEEGWHVYSQYTAEGGSLPIVIEKSNQTDDYELKGKAVESDTIKKFNEIFGVYESFFDDSAILKQRVKLKNIDISEVSLSLSGQVCKKVCLQIDEVFTFSLNDNEKRNSVASNSNIDNDSVNNMLYGMVPEDIKLTEVTSVEKKSLWTIFGLGFLGGLLALLTPCVFPMIPLTVSFFTKKGDQGKGSGVSKAILYGFFILMVYLILSIPFHLLDSVNPDILNEISTNIWLNIIFFAVFVFFAFSFFGYYELTLPSSWTTKTTQGENAGGIIGIFFMALTLAIVSFSCTGPILGSLLAGSLTADGGAWQLTAGMAGFGVSLGLPFAIFAMFPNMMNALPKSGGWLNTTKVILGFLELALAFKFLSNADLVKRWGILKIEPFLVIWIIIFAGLALYLFGKIKFPHDSPIKKLSFTRIAGGILVASFAIYLASGFRVNKETNTFTSLTLLSGLAPPVGYSWFLPSNTTNNLKTFKDLKEGIAYAKQVNKPIMIDFTGYACVNCRKMEEHIWPLEKIDSYLRNDYVLISLYVDDKKDLPDNQKVEVNRVNGGTRLLKNYGHKWANFQTQFFKSNSQPYYVLFNPNNNEVLNEPVGYTPDEDEYAQFLQKGLDSFNKQN
ncbi:protein-disulfide reductase DsbD family protein [Jejuia spongiicola]|uniref:Thioredoxin fold domain-containing protein n=1 Tax=Jejuia spongiicola TaxID=2942207 RepID=A0ABT0QAJ3_9FLAO|nr:protein-disulfide reductase DsbD domain-containing protein [Jejuia spongiicola]MCL6294001.1 thioredoxin fold domain-containing protein [Jejuia spongiicola]